MAISLRDEDVERTQAERNGYLDDDNGEDQPDQNIAFGEFMDKYRDSIGKRILESMPPKYQPQQEITTPLPQLVRTPKGAQAHAIKAVAKALNEGSSANLIGEMGTGKTFTAIAGAQMAQARRVLVLCPPHLVGQWEDEVRQTLPEVYAKIVHNTQAMKKAAREIRALHHSNPEKPAFVILSREYAKLSYNWKPVAPKRPQRAGGSLVRDDDAGETVQVIQCPQCGLTPENSKGEYLEEADLKRNKRKCSHCQGALWEANKNGIRRQAVGDYICRRLDGFFDLLIVDEVHEYKARSSGQGNTAGNLAAACGKSLSLTGTLMGGYASTIFFLLYRFSHQLKEDFTFHDVQKWINLYGFEEEVIKTKQTQGADGKTTKSREDRSRVKEKPGLSPQALGHILHNSIFLRLKDVARDLPPYTEHLALTSLDNQPEPDEEDILSSPLGLGTAPEPRQKDVTPLPFDPALTQNKGYKILHEKVAKAIKEYGDQPGKASLVSTFLQELLTYPDTCTEDHIVYHPLTGQEIAMIPALQQNRLYPKERQLVDLVNREKAAGRRCLIYISHTNRRDLTPRLEYVLGQKLIKTGVLRSHSTAARNRADWIRNRVEEGIDVLIANPKLVALGMNLLQFPTIIWYELDYSIYITRQASRRSWRIGQDRDVDVHFMAARGTMQHTALELVGQKMKSSLMVEGEMPEDALAQHAAEQEDDLMMALARRIISGAPMPDDTIEELFRQARDRQQDEEEMLNANDWNFFTEYDEDESQQAGANKLLDRQDATETGDDQTVDPQSLIASWEEIFGITGIGYRTGK